jgi:hypothetical protein
MSALLRPNLVIKRRGVIVVAVLILCSLIFAFNLRTPGARLRNSVNSAVLAQRRVILDRQRAITAAELAEDDADVRSETLRWTNIISNLTGHMTSQRSSTPREDLVEHPAIESRNAGHWAFENLMRVRVPTVLDQGRARNPIDRFIIARLEQNGLSLQPPASPWILARRLWLGVTGLPPEPEDIRQIENADSEDFDRFVDDLLTKTVFGEHFARAWLDLARYADSNGYEEDELRPHAYPYRDFVIWAFNYDLPFDDFVRWQIAGDELNEENPMAVAATGFAVAGPYNTFMPQESERYDELDDIVSTMGAAMLGLSIGCARCHDHPYDDVASREYYSLVSIFHPTRRELRYLLPDGGREFRKLGDPYDQRMEEVQQILLTRVKDDNIEELEFTDAEKDLLRQPIDLNNEEQISLLSRCNRCLLVDESYIEDDTEPLPQDKERYDRLRAEMDELWETLPRRPIQGLTIAGSKVVAMPILKGGALANKGPNVGPGFLAVLTAGDVDWSEDVWRDWDSQQPQPRPRAALANWMTDKDRGAGALVARVIVNRVWQHHFGRGLVITPSNFGYEGEPPSHPDLLEWLAVELVDSGWSLKHIHRLILNSATYRQSTASAAETYRIDPDNRWFSRWSRKRLTAEMFRDSLLRLGGNLNSRVYGPAFQPSIPRDAIFNRDTDDIDETWPTNVVARPEVWRRSIYILKRRTNPVPMLQLFDASEGTFSCAQRSTTTVPTQALALWNSQLVRAQSARIALRLRQEASDSEAALVDRVFMLLVGRHIDQEENSKATSFLRQGGKLADLCQVLLMTNEFWYID